MSNIELRVPMNLMSTSASNIPASPASLRGGSPPDELPQVVGVVAEGIEETIIEPRKGWIAVDWAELRRSRELLYFLVWRDIKVRYKQAALGILWAVLVPVVQVTIFTLIFSSGLSLASLLGPSFDKSHYPVYIFSAILVWQVISRSMTDGGLSLINQQHLLTKIYFPRLFVPTAAVGGALFDLVISLPVFALVMAWVGVPLSWNVLLFPLLAVHAALLGSGLAYLLSALTVTYRDFRFIIPFVNQILMWVSFIMIPVPPQLLESWKWQTLFHLNPVYGIVAGARKALMDLNHGWSWTAYLTSLAVTLAIFTFGVFFFRRTERRFADIA